MAGFPITIEVSGRLAVVVGLGAVGLRKARGLIEAGAIVRGIDPRPSAESSSIGVEVVAEPYREGHLEGALLAFAAASPEVNRLVVADCRRRGLLVNSASAPESGNFAVPAIHRSGPILLSVATSGAGPALAAMLRDRAAGAIGPAAAGFAALLAELRPIVLDRIADEPARRALFRRWADPDWLDRWDAEGPEAVRRALLASIEHDAAKDRSH